ncbi:hypothetical protein [Mucilaginibacter sp. PPCGB 2223]|uniref:glycine-rich domain-containing protein n=1 Tax=Mucilaginibacter sp. PPCGB 2223 TaxID=1886027 RepID=UPI0011123FEB|nr:hypothetical protein [Mucilaginibacter sp. PPCGB 2223]
MESQLWEAVFKFNLDEPLSEYGFSTRLENENYWPANFAAKAIVEYKKFMYLAAISDEMVSPSVIVDIVWHQHLIFTQSYDAFCTVLGKRIAHIPSTHTKSDFALFDRAKSRTEKLYKENFGVQPAEIWNAEDIYAPLSMNRAKSTIEKRIGIAFGLLIPLFAVAYYLLQPLYIRIDNPYFIEGYSGVFLISIISLEVYNSGRVSKIIKQWPQNSFVFNLAPLELVYLKSNGITPVIHGVVNNLVANKNIRITSDEKLITDDVANINNPAMFCAAQAVAANPGISYPALVNLLKLKPAFNKTVRSMDALKAHIRNSEQLIRIFDLNFAILYVVLLLGLVRLATGILREKPVTIIIGFLVVFALIAIGYLYRLTTIITTYKIPAFYKDGITPTDPEYDTWDWQYFLLGSAVFVWSFAPLTTYVDNNTFFTTDTSGSGSSCGSNCGGGSSCGGSSCGGCGSD